MEGGVEMIEIPQKIRFLLFGFGPQMHAVMALITNLLAIATTILGIISAAKQSPLGWVHLIQNCRDALV